uniref:Transcription factor Spi-C n=1 Tax=Oryzias sinensis TaxID=183150 RepID=A0A8C7ZP32_9TELE
CHQRASDLPLNLSWHTTLDRPFTKVRQHQCLSVGQCQTLYQQDNQQNTKKVRLFHFLFEMLEDPSMAHCLSWVPAATGVFRFSSRNKDQVAALWGQKKGNKRPMTYQKMSRALRNYARSGEIFKVKKKLTYQFEKCVYGHLVYKISIQE